jgi:hypothetical protein
MQPFLAIPAQPMRFSALRFWADRIGIAEIYRRIAAWHQRYERWTPAALLRRLAETGTPFSEARSGDVSNRGEAYPPIASGARLSLPGNRQPG